MPSVDGDSAGTNYRRGVFWRDRGVFAGRGIALPGFRVTALVIAGAFALGLATGWATGFVPEMLRADPSPSPSPTPVPSVTATAAPVLPPMSPITRALNADDREAGIVTTEILLKGEGTFSVVPGVGTPVEGNGDVRFVSVAIEDGVNVDPVALKTYVIDTLNANRGWGTSHAVQFVATDGVADYRIVVASPYTAAVLCPDPHAAIAEGTVTEASEEPSAAPSPSASPSPEPAADSPWSCGQDGVLVISTYDWTAGYDAYATDYAGSRTYLLHHYIGHLMGRKDETCAGGRAGVMVVQQDPLPEGCEANPWPNPDAPEQFVTPSPTPSP